MASPMQSFLTISNRAVLTNPTGAARQRLRERLTFPNPKYEENEKHGFSNYNVPEKLCYLSVEDDSLMFPRGFTRQAISLIRNTGHQFQVQDKRRLLPKTEFTFSGELREYQQDALREIIARDFGTVSIPTGGGKTVIALAAIAQRKQPSLILVHTRELQDQWCKRIGTFLGIPQHEIGLIGGGKCNVGERITVAMVQSLFKCAREVSQNIGHLIVDECHRAPARMFTEAVTAFDCRYMLGLSATPYRRDGLGRLLYWFIGDRVFNIEREDLIESEDILPAEVITRQTSFRASVDPSEQYSAMLSELCRDRDRNMLIATDVAKEARNGNGVCLVLSDRKAHCELLQEALSMRGTRATLLTGDLNERERRQVVSDIENGKTKVIVATAQLIGEGFDAKELSTLFLATPIKFSGRLIQCLGRVLRPASGKDKAVVYDYVDPVGVLQSAARSRAGVYRQVA